jgi:sugar lactone lactonase YvrE
MKHFVIPISLLICFTTFSIAAENPSFLFACDTLLKAPESAVYDANRNVIYVSNYTSSITEGGPYGEHSISKVSLDGEVLEADWIKGLSCPTGICILDDKLLIVERFGVVEYNLTKDEVSHSYYIKTTGFLNDITSDPEGNIYITVSDTNVLYRISKNRVEKWIVDNRINHSNGILYHNGKLLIAVIGDGSLKQIDPETKVITKLADLGKGTLDGIKTCEADYLVTIFEGRLLRISPQGNVKEILNTQGEGIFQADFEYIPSKELLIIPALWNNKLLFYKYSP